MRNVISTALIVLPMSLGAQESVDYLRRENKRLRYERDSLMAVIDGFRSMSISTWDMLTDLEFEDDIAAVFGSSSVIYNEDRGHSDLMDAVRRAAPAVATKWNQFIDDQIGVYTGSRRRYLPTIFGRYELWYPLFRNTFAKYGVPEELIYLCIVESAVSRRAVSSAGAAGIWQLMPGTAKHYGLRVAEFVDESNVLVGRVFRPAARSAPGMVYVVSTFRVDQHIPLVAGALLVDKRRSGQMAGVRSKKLTNLFFVSFSFMVVILD